MLFFLACAHPIPPPPPPPVLVAPTVPSLGFRVRAAEGVRAWVWLDQPALVPVPVVWEDRSPICWIPPGQGAGWTRLPDCEAAVSEDGAWGMVGQADAVALGMASRRASALGGPVNSAWRAPCGALRHEQALSRVRCGEEVWSLPPGSAQAAFAEPSGTLWLILDRGPQICLVALNEEPSLGVCAPDPAHAG